MTSWETYHWPVVRRFVRPFMALTATVALTVACSSGKSSPNSASASSASSGSKIELIPDMSGFLKPGSTTTCYNGGERPCAIQIRVGTDVSTDKVNVDPNQTGRVEWPLESYAGQAGDKVIVDCVTTGQEITPFTGDTPPSNEWYEVEVPAEQAVNPNLKHPHEAQVGYAAIQWFNQSEPVPGVRPC